LTVLKFVHNNQWIACSDARPNGRLSECFRRQVADLIEGRRCGIHQSGGSAPVVFNGHWQTHYSEMPSEAAYQIQAEAVDRLALDMPAISCYWCQRLRHPSPSAVHERQPQDPLSKLGLPFADEFLRKPDKAVRLAGASVTDERRCHCVSP